MQTDILKNPWYSVRLTGPINACLIEELINLHFPDKIYFIGEHKGTKKEQPHIHAVINDIEDVKSNHTLFRQWLRKNYYPNDKLTNKINSKLTTDIPKRCKEGSIYDTFHAIAYILSGTIRNQLNYETNIPEDIIDAIKKFIQQNDYDKVNNTVKDTIEETYYNIIYDTIHNNIDKEFNNYLMPTFHTVNIQNKHKIHLKYLSQLVLSVIDDHQCLNKKFLRYNKLEEIILNGMYIYFNKHKNEYPEYFESLKKTRIPKILKEIEFI